MKKLFSFTTLIFLVLALLTVSCEKSPEELLIGKWEIQTLNFKTYENNVLQDQETETYTANEMVLEFLEGGSGKEYSDNVLTSTFSWAVDGDICTISNPGEEPFDLNLSVGEDNITFSMEESETDGGIVYKYVMTFSGKRI